MPRGVEESEYPLVEVADAIKAVLDRSTPPSLAGSVEPVGHGILGRVLREDVHFAEDIPNYRASCKDGYAIPEGDDSVRTWKLVGQGNDAGGGGVESTIRAGEAMYVATGGAVPAGASSVVMVEHVSLDAAAGTITLIDAVPSCPSPGTDIRSVGSDAAAGSVALAAGTRVGPHELGLLVAAGSREVSLHRRVRVGVMSTGDELCEPDGSPLPPGRVRDSNRPMLAAAIAAAVGPGGVVDLGHAADSAEAVEKALLDARRVHRCDVVVTSGGVSMGRKDYVKPVLARVGTVHFGRVRVKPGKPLMFATVPGSDGDGNGDGGDNDGPGAFTRVFGLPGNPVSAMVTFYAAVLPCLRSLSGWPRELCGLTRIKVTLAAAIRMDKARPEYHRITLKRGQEGGEDLPLAFSTGSQGSSRLMSMAGCDALLEVPAGEGSLPQGSVGTALLLPESSRPWP